MVWCSCPLLVVIVCVLGWAIVYWAPKMNVNTLYTHKVQPESLPTMAACRPLGLALVPRPL